MAIVAGTLRTSPALHPITSDVYQRMIASGDLPEDARLELIDGMIVRKDRSAVGDDFMTVASGHRFATLRVADIHSRIKPLGAILQSQQPIELDELNTPEPDGAILIGPDERYRDRLPFVNEVTAVLEVADSSLKSDRTTKQSIYAAASIPQYVIVNLVDRVIEVHTNPNAAAAKYDSVTTKRPGEVVTLNLPEGQTFDVPVNDLLP